MKNIYFFLITLLMLSGSIRPACAQNPEWLLFTTTNCPLPSNYIYSVCVDNQGNRWIGTDNGLAKFDGKNWTIYTKETGSLPDNFIEHISADKTNNIWVSTDNGLARFNGTWKIFDESNSMVPNYYVYCTVADNQNIKWVGTDTYGLLKYDNTNWSVYDWLNSDLPDYTIFSIAIDSKNSKWIGTQAGLTVFDGNSTWNTYDQTNSQIPSDEVNYVAIDKSDVKWLGTSNGAARFDGKAWTVYNTTNSNLPNDFIWSTAIDNTNNKWFCTDSGLAKFDGTTWTVFTTANSGMMDNVIHNIAFDSQGNKWIATETGLAVYREGGVVGIDNPDITVQTPQNLTLTVNSDNLSLSWKAVPTLGITYRVYRSQTSGSNYTLIRDTLKATMYNDLIVQKGTTYYYVVKAYDVSVKKESSASNEVSGKIEQPPNPPLNLRKITDSLIISLAWDASSTPSVVYRIYRSETKGNNYKRIKDSISSLFFIDNSAKEGITYYYFVVSYLPAKQIQSIPSNEVSANLRMPPLSPDAPKNLRLINDTTYIELAWDEYQMQNIVYRLYRSETKGSGYVLIKNAITATSFTDSSIKKGIIYYYVVKSYNTLTKLESTASNEVTASIKTAGIDDYSIRECYQIYLNQSNLTLELKSCFKLHGNITLTLFDLLGNIVLKKSLFVAQPENVSFSEIISCTSIGMYFYLITGGSEIISGNVSYLN
ncbi:MAG: hypothetical protein HW421_946 [Ignavibacteria bacterium]|nr:hypothetical protein [Ignavibacteria bacterium]